MKPNSGVLRTLLMMAILLLLSVLVGCAGMGLEYAPRGQYLYYHVELPAAERAVEAARRAGKDKECPDEFKAVEMMGNKAYETYWACRTKEAIAMANEVTIRANALCPPKKVVLPPLRPPCPSRRAQPRSRRASARLWRGPRRMPPAPRSTRESARWIQVDPGRYAPAARRNTRSPRSARADPDRHRRRSA